MRTQKLHAMVFDFDGTLADVCIDFAHMRRESIQAAMDVAGHLLSATPRHPATSTTTATPETAAALETSEKPAGGIHDTGQPVLEWLAAAHTYVAKKDEIVAQAMSDAVHRAIIKVETEAARRSTLFTWTRPLLATLRKHNIAALVITRNCREAVETVFPDIHQQTDGLLTRNDVPNIKPHPDHLHRALEITGIAPEHAIMVGDHPMDIVTGKAAGTLTAGVTSGHASAQALTAEAPDYLADNGYALYSVLHGRFWPHTDRLILPPAA